MNKEWTDVEKATWILENGWSPNKLVWISAPPYSYGDEPVKIQYIPSTAPPWWTADELGPFDKLPGESTQGRWSPKAQMAFEKAKRGMRIPNEKVV